MTCGRGADSALRGFRAAARRRYAHITSAITAPTTISGSSRMITSSTSTASTYSAISATAASARPILISFISPTHPLSTKGIL